MMQPQEPEEAGGILPWRPQGERTASCTRFQNLASELGKNQPLVQRASPPMAIGVAAREATAEESQLS